MDPILAIAASRLGARERRRLRADPRRLSSVPFSRSQLSAAQAIANDSRARGHQLLCFGDEDYPRSLAMLEDAPWVLYLSGNRSFLQHSLTISVVGSRRGTMRGRWQAESLGRDLARAGACVVSGLALGVDALAHRGALAANGACIGVIATGLDVVHPRAHRDLHQEIAGRGLLVSEYPPGTLPRKYAFVARNRILAATGRVVVVVEASSKSGALSTVDFALQVGHDVFCYPGPVDCACNQGSLRLLREGAVLVRHGADVLESLGAECPHTLGWETPLGLTAQAETAEEIARRLGRRLPDVLVTLEELLDRGRVRRIAGGRWQVTN